MTLITRLMLVAIGGAIGSCLRDRIGVIGVISTKGLGVLLCNVIGCLIIGMLFEAFRFWNVGETWRLLLFTGLLGGFTTFSSYGLEAVVMCQNGEIIRGLTYILATNVGGLMSVALGVLVMRSILKCFLA